MLPLTAQSHRAGAKWLLFPDVSRYASIQASSQEVLWSQREESAAKLGFFSSS